MSQRTDYNNTQRHDMVSIVTVTRILRIAMGYGSREERLDRMQKSEHLDVRWLTERLRQGKLLDEKGVKYVP